MAHEPQPANASRRQRPVMTQDAQVHPDQSAWRRFGLVPLAVFQDPRLSPADKVVYGVISMHCGKNGKWQIGQALLAKEAAVAVRTVVRSVRKLRDLGLFDTEGHGKSLCYILNVPKSAATIPQTTKEPTATMSEQKRQNVRAETTECPRDHQSTSTKETDKHMHGECSTKRLSGDATAAAEALAAVGFDHAETFVLEHGIQHSEVISALARASTRESAVDNLPGLLRTILLDGAPGEKTPRADPELQSLGNRPQSIRERYLEKRGNT